MIGYRDRRAQLAYLRERLDARGRVIAALQEATIASERQRLRTRLRMIRRQICTACTVIRADREPDD